MGEASSCDYQIDFPIRCLMGVAVDDRASERAGGRTSERASERTNESDMCVVCG